MSARTAAPFWLAALLFIGFWLGSANTPLFDLDEGAFSQATLEMLSSGNFLTTTLDGAPRYDKPMLSYWLQGASVVVFGVTEFAFRLPSMLAATAWALWVFFFVRRRSDTWYGAYLAAGALCLSPGASLIGHAATADAILNLLLAAALLDIYRWFESPRGHLLLRVYLWMGLGVLTKGPVAILLPLLISLLYALWQGRWRDWLRAAFDLRGMAVLLAVVLPWGMLSWLSDGGDFIRHFLFDHNFGRYQHTLQGHGGTPLYYLAAIPLILWPFVALLPGALKRGLLGDALDRYCLVWFVTVFVLFSFSSTQLPHYALYGATPLFILFGRNLRQLPARFWLLLPGLLLLLLFATLPWVLDQVHTPAHRAWEAGVIAAAKQAFTPTYFWLCGGALLAGLAAFWLHSRATALLTMAAAGCLAMWLAIVPVLAAAQQEPTRQAARMAARLDLPVVRFRTYLPTFSVYRGQPTPEGVPAAGTLVFIRADKLPALQRAVGPDRLDPVYASGGVRLLKRVPAATADDKIPAETEPESMPDSTPNSKTDAGVEPAA